MAKEKNKGLGKGLSALFGDDINVAGLTQSAKQEKDAPKAEKKEVTDEPVAFEGERVEQIALDHLKVNPFQPRKVFDEDALTDLSESIREKGIISPLLVVAKGDEYILVAGERRMRAARMAGLTEVPAIVRDLSSEEMAQLALIENIQRADLSAIEEARGYASLIKEYGYTQQQLADLIGKSRPHIANLLRLLDLPEPVMDALNAGQISAGHARALLGVKDPALAAGLCSDVISQDLSVRALEKMIKDIHDFNDKMDGTEEKKPTNQWHHLQHVGDQLTEQLQTKVSIKGTKKRGQLVIDFYGDDDLGRILDVLGINLY